jgi:hypothetical protein
MNRRFWGAGCAALLGLCVMSPERALGQGTYTVVPGQRVERSLAVPCALEFNVTNKMPTDAAVEEHLSWAVTEGMDWQGGNPAAGTYTAAYRDYKLKVYSAAGFAGEQRIDVAWDPAQVYTVRAEIRSDRAVYAVKKGGVVIAETTVSAAAPLRVTMGYGWPPSVRNGASGAILSNIKWEESTVVTPGPGFEAQADTFTEEIAPAANHGGEVSVQTGGNGRIIFLQFQVSGDAGAISSALLNLEAVNAGGGGEIHFVPDSGWSEFGVTHSTKPCLSSTVLSRLGRVEVGGRYTFDVTAAVPGNGTYSFAIRSSEADGSAYHSRESSGGMHPTLVVTRGTRPAMTGPAGCTAPIPDAGAPDSGTRIDAAIGIDAGSSIDASVEVDAGFEVDSSLEFDGGSAADATHRVDAAPVSAADSGSADATLDDTGAGVASYEAFAGGCSYQSTADAPVLAGLFGMAAAIGVARRRGRR